MMASPRNLSQQDPIHICGWLLIVLSLEPQYTLSVIPSSGLINPSSGGCSCPGEVLTYVCNAEGQGSTIWNGSAFECVGNAISLFHRLFADMDGTSGECNDGDIIANSLRVDGNYYVSQLNVTISAGLHNKSVGCFVRTTNQMMIHIGTSPLITVGSVLYRQAPYQVKIIDVNTRALTISWTPVASICSSVSYNIISDQCGTCNTTSESRAVCSDFHLPSVCTFSIQYVVCGQAGVASNPITINLAVPTQPVLRRIIPVYSSDSKSLLGFKVAIDQQVLFNITDVITGFVTSYNVKVSETTSTVNASTSSCVQGVCENVVNISSSLCEGIANITFELSVSNVVGVGPPLNITIGCLNDFVQVEYDPDASSVTCQFLNQTDRSIKACSVMYGQCERTLVHTMESNTTMEAPNIASLTVNSDKLDCYRVTAQSESVMVIVEGQVTKTGMNNHIMLDLVPVVLTVIIIIAAIIIALSIIIVVIKFLRKDIKQETADETFRETLQPSNKSGDEIHQLSQDKKAIELNVLPTPGQEKQDAVKADPKMDVEKHRPLGTGKGQA